jgi:hypothetical protein
MVSRSMRRAIRSAPAVIHGHEILAFTGRQKVRQKLIAAAKAGVPPVTAISPELAALVGPKDVKLPPVKQFAGLCVRAILEEEGFQLADKGVRISKDPVFRTGSTYVRVNDDRAAGRTLLARFVQVLSDEEARELLQLLSNRIQV